MQKLAGDYHKQKIEKEHGVLLRILVRADCLLREFKKSNDAIGYAKLEECIYSLSMENIFATNGGEHRLPPILEQRIMAVKYSYFDIRGKMQAIVDLKLKDHEWALRYPFK